MNSVTDNKTFWRTVKPLFTDKIQTTPSITLIKNEKLITEENVIAETFKEFFTNIINTIYITPSEFIHSTTSHLLNPIEIAIEKYKRHPCILKIKDKVTNVSSFEFRPVTVTTVNEEPLRLNPKKHL